MNLLQRLRERFWFVPAVLCLVSFLVAQLLVEVEERVTVDGFPGWFDTVFLRVGESGSRDILGAIATSSLAVAGTTFSITMAVLALTSSSYGPRLVRNFMADRGNQIVLGVYVATFLYSLLVLRSVRAIGDPGDPEAEVFVPHLAVNLAVVLAVLNVAVLIYFIHHISSSIQISSIAGRVRRDLHDTVERLYPEELGLGPDDLDDVEEPADAELPDRLPERSHHVCARAPGYVQYVRVDALFDAARRHDVLVALAVRPGDYAIADQVLAYVHPEPVEEVDGVAALEEAIVDAIVIGGSRSPYQDIEFAVQQLTELAVRAVSPSTNDPFTAVNALDDLSSGLTLLAERHIPSPARFDDRGVLRVHAPAPDVVDLVSDVLDHIRWYGSDQPPVVRGAYELIERVGGASRHRSVRARLLRQLHLLVEAVERAGLQDHDVELLRAEADDVAAVLARGAGRTA
ncbi:DUF2254 domain-containing protein [Actinomarinicola tropica]|uniref:DUF2254 domain-containing protein n=1 Tax=Actinomarinicola tropica TaxID=2789776 RepID=UPI00189A63DD|nr:DUF2254 domain-containing protein [Actinomarinicola tropica]